jgi:hypothetical protein
MAHVVDIIDHDVISEITTDDRAVIEAHRQPDVVKRKIEWFKLPDPDKTKKLAIFYEFGSECIGNQNAIPVVRGISIANKHFDFKRC